MAILLIAEHDNASLSDQTAKALTAAAQIGGDVDILVAGKGAKAAADAAAKLAVAIQGPVVELVKAFKRPEEGEASGKPHEGESCSDASDEASRDESGEVSV